MKKDFTTYTQKQILICRSTSRISHTERVFLFVQAYKPPAETPEAYRLVQKESDIGVLHHKNSLLTACKFHPEGLTLLAWL